ncbi:hypothetical protein DFP73DRAFT_569872 [Morchella snyderi]|nr:hypothetical protein DFP73DRAFT_569872 [Morchella snyderi]
MADPLSIVGLILTTQGIIKLCLRQYKIMSDCTGEARNLREDLEEMEILLGAIQSTLEPDLPARLDELNNFQQEIIRHLRTYLEKISEVLKGFPADTNLSLWTKYKWGAARSSVASIKEQMLECQGKLQISLTLRIKQDTNLLPDMQSTGLETRDKVNAEAEEKNRKATLDWFFADIAGGRHQEVRDRREKDTGKWFFEMEDFGKWINREISWLECRGRPGVGKTFMMSNVIDYVSDTFGEDHESSQMGIAFVYFNYKDQKEQEPSWIFRNILRQLLTRRATIPEKSKALYKRYSRGCRGPNLDELKQAIVECACEFRCTWLLFDALDECTDNHRDDIVSALQSFNNIQSPVQIFFTCRPHTVDLQQNCNMGVIDLTAREKDIETVVLSRMKKSIRWSKVLPDSTVEKIVKAVVKRSDGMFFLAACLVNHILRARNIEDIMNSIHDMPKDLSEYFRVTMNRIRECTSLKDKELALDIITWTIHAARPFNIEELRIMLAFEKRYELPKERDEIIGVCLGLVSVEGTDHICRLTHQTLQEYFDNVKEENDYIRQRAKMIVKASLHFISYYSPTLSMEDEDQAPEFRLYEYAVCNWGPHLKATPTIDRDLYSFIMSCFRKQRGKLGIAMRIAMMMATGESEDATYFDDPAGLLAGHLAVPHAGPIHAAAFWGITALAEILIREGCDLNPIDSCGRTPLSWAAEKGFTEIVKALTTAGLTDTALNVRCGNYGRTPLCSASENGHVEVVKVLIDAGADVNLASENGQTPISWAAEKGFEKVVSTLAKREGIDVNFRDRAGRSPLSWAVYMEHEAVVRLLVDCKAVDLNHDVGVWPEWDGGCRSPATILDIIKEARSKRSQLEISFDRLANLDIPPEPAQAPPSGRVLSSATCISLQLRHLEISADWMVIMSFWAVSLFSVVLAYFASFLYMCCRGYGAVGWGT